MNISIKPVDVLFFRDSKPFGRGSEHFTRSIFPPFSQTLYGAFRTKVLEDVGCDYEEFKKGNLIPGKNKNKIDIEKIKKEIGTPAEPGQFLLKGPLILKDDEVIYLKIPADVKCSKENGKQYMILKPFDWKTVGIETDFDGDQCFPHIKSEVPLENVEGYISLSDFVSSYLIGEKNFEAKCIEEPENIFQYEMRIGLKINSESYTAEERMLYTVGVVRLNINFSLFVRIENLTTLKPDGLIKLGGMNKACEYRELSNNPLNVLSKAQEQIKEKIYNTKKFKIIFLTPSYFKSGWWFNTNPIKIYGVEIKLITALINKPVIFSGWDLAENKPKPAKKFVPEGSVYYCELLDGSVDTLFEKLNFANLSEENSKFGYGLTIIGGV